jgi:hypothetical protein
MQTVQVKVIHKYGVERIYPINDTAKLLCQLMRSKSFTRDDIKVVKELGYTIDVESVDFNKEDLLS